MGLCCGGACCAFACVRAHCAESSTLLPQIWITMNYVLRQKGLLAAAETVGCLDMGGGSAQIAYEIDDSVDPAAPLSPNAQPGSVHKFGFWYGEPERTVFVSSLIGFGTNEGRRRYVQGLEAGTGHGESALSQRRVGAGSRVRQGGPVGGRAG